MTCRLARHEPSLTSRKLKPPLLSRRVRIQPCTTTLWPIAAAWRAALTEIFSLGMAEGAEGATGETRDGTRILGPGGRAENLTQGHRGTEKKRTQIECDRS